MFQLRCCRFSSRAEPAASLERHSGHAFDTGRLHLYRQRRSIVPRGRTLPGAAEWQIADSLLYTFGDSAMMPGVTFSHRYISTAPGALVANLQELGGYNLFDIRLSATIAGVGVAAFVENIGDERGVTQAVTNNRGISEYLVRPRTYGVTFDYRF